MMDIITSVRDFVTRFSITLDRTASSLDKFYRAKRKTRAWIQYSHEKGGQFYVRQIQIYSMLVSLSYPVICWKLFPKIESQELPLNLRLTLGQTHCELKYKNPRLLQIRQREAMQTTANKQLLLLTIHGYIERKEKRDKIVALNSWAMFLQKLIPAE